MNKKFLISIICIMLFCLISCGKNKEEKQNTEETQKLENSIYLNLETESRPTIKPQNYYQFLVRKIPAEIIVMENPCDLYSIYLYETAENEKHFITTLMQPPSFKDDGFSWFYPGGGFFYKVLTENSVLKVFYGETPEGKDAIGPWIDESPSLEIKMNEMLVPQDPEYIEIPLFTRELKYDENKSNLFGEDVFYIQEILYEMVGSTVIVDKKEMEFAPDGYFGKCSEAAVKEYQKMKGIEETGIVDKELWNVITKKENITRY